MIAPHLQNPGNVTCVIRPCFVLGKARPQYVLMLDGAMKKKSEIKGGCAPER